MNLTTTNFTDKLKIEKDEYTFISLKKATVLSKSKTSPFIFAGLNRIIDDALLQHHVDYQFSLLRFNYLMYFFLPCL